jgi:hypothetical protein
MSSSTPRSARATASPLPKSRVTPRTWTAGDGGEAPGLVEVALGEHFLAEPAKMRVGEARALGDAFVVLSSQQTGGERRPDRGAEAHGLVERCVLALDSITVQQVVLRLFHARAD